jgi:hypothetical protein
MSIYGINKVCQLAQTDLNFRELLRHDPATAIAGLPLSDDERDAILSGDVASLYQRGAHAFLLSRLPRFGSLGLTRDMYIERMRALLKEV